MIYRTLNDIKVIDPSLRTLRFNRSLRDAGWPDEISQEDDYHPEVIIVYAAAAVVLLVVGIVAWWL